MEFTVLPARLEFEALDDIYLAPGKETNVFRGALGLALRQVCCPTQCRGAETCAQRRSCTYARLFEPVWEDGPSGYRDAPRPFVLRMVSAGARIGAGNVFGADLYLFDSVRPAWVELTQAFVVAAATGLGSGRGRARFRGVSGAQVTPVRLPVRGEDRQGRIRVRFMTPTELKSEGEVRVEPDFETLMHRLVERVWALGRLYQGWPGDWEYRDLLDQARMVRLVGWDWERSETVRRSSRTGQSHSIGGFRGWADYEGPVGVFLPLLEIGRWTGVGRQTVWGKGEIRVEEPGSHQLAGPNGMY